MAADHAKGGASKNNYADVYDGKIRLHNLEKTRLPF
jgi:hypothetical protein